MEVNRNLLNPHFEGYKLSFNESKQPICDFINLEIEAFKESDEIGNKNEFQMVADRIYENKLMNSKSHFSYLNSNLDLAIISKSLKSALTIKGPFKAFYSASSSIVALADSGLLELISFENDTFARINLSLSVDYPNSCKFISAKMIENKIVAIIQRTGLVKDVEGYTEEAYGKVKDKTAFSFLLLTVPLSNAESDSTLKYIGWSQSRPLANFIVSTSTVIIGTNSGLICEGFDDNAAVSNRIVNESDFLPSDDEEEEEFDSFNDCMMVEYSTSESKMLRRFPEIKISGESVKDLQVASKYLYDVVVFDLSGESEGVHISTFPAIDFIQCGKIDRKFTILGKEFAFILESGGNVYCYAKPPLKGSTSPQFLIQLDEEVLGWSHEAVDSEDNSEFCEYLFILSCKKLYKLSLKKA